MRDRLRYMFAQPGVAGLLLVFGLALIFWPALSPSWVTGDLAFYYYIYLVWAGLIVLAYLLARAGDGETGQGSHDV